MAKHTPGPWVVNDAGEIEAQTAILGQVYGAEDYPCIDQEEIDEVAKECIANARLIALAPEMLGLLKAASSALKSYVYGNVAPDLAKEVSEEVDALISRAEGEATNVRS